MVASVELHAGFVRFIEGDQKVDFHLRWLRQHFHLDTHLGSGAPRSLGIADIALEQGVLRVRWDREHRTSRFPLQWLRDHAHAMNQHETTASGRPGVAVPTDHVPARVPDPGGVLGQRPTGALAADAGEAWLIALAAAGLSRISPRDKAPNR